MGVPLNHPKSSILMGFSIINQEYLWKPPYGIAFCCQMCPSSLRFPAVFGERLMARTAHRTTSVVATHCLEKCRDAEKFTGYPKLAILMRKVMMDYENSLCSFVFFLSNPYAPCICIHKYVATLLMKTWRWVCGLKHLAWTLQIWSSHFHRGLKLQLLLLVRDTISLWSSNITIRWI